MYRDYSKMGQRNTDGNCAPNCTPGCASNGSVIYGIDAGVVPTATEVDITVVPQEAHLLDTLVLSQTVADSFIIDDIRVGNKSLLALNASFSAAVFVQDAVARLFFDGCIVAVGTNLVVSVENVSAGDARFIATALGHRAN